MKKIRFLLAAALLMAAAASSFSQTMTATDYDGSIQRYRGRLNPAGGLSDGVALYYNGAITGVDEATITTLTVTTGTISTLTVTNATAAAGSNLTLNNTAADVTGQRYMIDSTYTDNADVDADFLRFRHNAGATTALTVDSAGAIAAGLCFLLR